MLLTIFTPAYNRAGFLNALYESIISQPNKEKFEWLIIDDGSIDDTKNIVDGFIKEDKINIRYVYQENQGKMQAHNTALRHAKGRWFFCVDSDDIMRYNSLEWFFDKEKDYFDDAELAGILTFKKMKNSHNDSANVMPVNDGDRMNKGTLIFEKGFKGEVGVFFKTDILRQYPFPKFGSEKYIPENIVYDQIDRKYKYIIFNEFFQICEYQTDGYTANSGSLELKNPKGTAAYFNQAAKYQKKFINKLKVYAIYCAYAMLGGNKKIIRNGNNKFLCFFAYPVGKWYKRKLIKKLNELNYKKGEAK